MVDGRLGHWNGSDLVWNWWGNHAFPKPFLATFSCEFLLREDDKDEQSPSLMYLSYRKGRKYILEMYNPHCFAWYHGFKQRLLGTHVFSSYYIDSSSLYHASLSLTRQGSGATFHVLKVNNLISSDIDPSYIAWWDKKMFPQFINIYIRVLSQSENSNFSLNLSEKTRSISRDKEKASTKVVLPPPSFQKHGRPKLQHQSFTKQTWKNSSSLQASIQHKTSSENKGSNPLPPPYSPREVDNSSNKTPIIDLDNIPPQISSHSKHDTGDKDFKLLSPLFSPKEMVGFSTVVLAFEL